MNLTTQSQIFEHIEFVHKGKPCSVLPIKKDEVDIAIELVRGYGSLHYIEDSKDKAWVNFWIYKNPVMLEIIKQLPDDPIKPIDHFVLGCAFGYSIEAILNFIKKENEDNKTTN